MLQDLYQFFSPEAFSIGKFTVTWYGLGYIVSFILAAILAHRICKRWGVKLSFDSLLTLLIACILGVIIGGRLGYVLFYNLDYYLANPAKIIAINEGGMSFHGGLVGFAIGAIITSRLINIPIATLADISGISVPIGLGIVRFANFINGELWGSVTDLPWGVVFDGAGPLPRHPTQLYEAFLEGVVLLVVLYILARRKPPFHQGTYFGLFSIGYGLFRIAVEFIRQPDYQVGYLFGTEWVTMGMALSLPMIFVGMGFIAYARHFKYPQAEEVPRAGSATHAQKNHKQPASSSRITPRKIDRTKLDRTEEVEKPASAPKHKK